MKIFTLTLVLGSITFGALAQDQMLALNYKKSESAFNFKAHAILKEDIIDTTVSPEKMREHLSANYYDFVIEKVIRRADAAGNVTYEASVTNKTYDFKLLYGADGSFIRDSDFLADISFNNVAATIWDRK